MNRTVMELESNQHRLRLLPSFAAHDVIAKTVFVADLHLGKTTAFHQAGIPLPSGSDEDTLRRLSEVISHTEADELIILGDVFHSTALGTRAAAELMLACRARHPQVRWMIVPGNHDRRVPWHEWLGDIPLLTEGECVGPWRVSHHPLEEVTETMTLCGHLHPGTAIGRARSSKVTMPCFWLRRQSLVLPAFGSFTGMHRITREEGDRVFVPMHEQVFELPVGIPPKVRTLS